MKKAEKLPSLKNPVSSFFLLHSAFK
jgi:hypothetical protein